MSPTLASMRYWQTERNFSTGLRHTKKEVQLCFSSSSSFTTSCLWARLKALASSFLEIHNGQTLQCAPYFLNSWVLLVFLSPVYSLTKVFAQLVVPCLATWHITNLGMEEIRLELVRCSNVQKLGNLSYYCKILFCYLLLKFFEKELTK